MTASNPKSQAPAGTPAKKLAGKKALTQAEKDARAAARKMEGADVRFLRLAKPRIAKVLAALKRLETIGRSPSYKYTPEQAARIMGYLDGGLEKVRHAFVARVNDRPEASLIQL